jgi:integrase
MMGKVLTARSVEAMKPDPARRVEVPDAAFPGLYLVVQPSGARSWAYRYRHGGKPRKLTIGRFPALSLAQAREKAGEAARAVDLGADPATSKVEAKARARGAQEAARDQVRTLVDLYDRRHLSGLRTGPAARGFIERSAVAAWGERDVRTITKRDVVDLLDGIVDRGSPIAANRTLAHLRAWFGWLKARDVIAVSPAEGVRPPVAERSRDRVLSDDEIIAFWRAAEALGEPFGPLYRLLLLTGQRLREAAGMRDAEIVGDVWTIPAARAKNGEAHVVPLSTAAQELLVGVRRIKGAGFVFTTMGAAPVSGFAKAKERLDTAMLKMLRKTVEDDGGDPADVALTPFVIHDLRRTAASGMARLGIAPHVVEAVLNHRTGTVSGVAKVYNRFTYEAEKRAALEAWGRYVLGLVGERQNDNVVRIGA